MSYSFTVRAATREAVKDLVRAEMEKVLALQPSHQIDIEHALANAMGAIDLVPEDSERDLVVTCNGYVSWVGTWGADPRTLGVSVGCSVHLIAREPA
ncbi:MAG: hypothetical protein KIT35_21815 [Piscinibacter sp.]|uniref:hypothetical protein n=1 Tax=Piscinibacter sp. TaxID=1903157 RepID=UPI002590458F|nr:hypothetical protein [Piscinibacter sp.]MCW5666477.1 hypothetical protein [Piscinibacter sp.]